MAIPDSLWRPNIADVLRMSDWVFEHIAPRLRDPAPTGQCALDRAFLRQIGGRARRETEYALTRLTSNCLACHYNNMRTKTSKH